MIHLIINIDNNKNKIIIIENISVSKWLHDVLFEMFTIIKNFIFVFLNLP